jgi:hypothetical protein
VLNYRGSRHFENNALHQFVVLNYICSRMGRKKKDAEAAFFADFENDEVATAAGDGEQEEPVVAGMVNV